MDLKKKLNNTKNMKIDRTIKFENFIKFFLIQFLFIPLLSESENGIKTVEINKNIRKVVDTTGFAQFDLVE